MGRQGRKAGKVSINGLPGNGDLVQTVLDSIADPTLVIDPRDYRVVLANQALQEMAGGRDPAGLALTCYEVSHHSDCPCKGLDCPLDMVVATKAPARVTHTHLDGRGRGVVVDIVATPVLDKEGKVVRVIESCRDITEQKKVEDALRESEEKYRKLVELCPDAIAVHMEGKLVYLNPAGVRLMGARSQGELLGRDIMDFVHPDYHQVVRERLRQMRETGKPGGLVEEKFIRLDGKVIHGEVASMPITYQGWPAIQVVIRDITERKEWETELKKYTEQLTEANMLKDLFTDIMRHDLLSPAGVVMSSAELLLEEESDEQKRQILKMIFNSSTKLVDIIDNASKLSRLEDMGDMEGRRVDLKDILGKCLDGFRDQFSELGMEVTHLPEGEYPVSGNPMMLEDLFSNLVSNALKYASEGKMIEIGIRDTDDSWTVHVKDWGKGIEDEYKEKIFTRFKRLDKGGVKGSGLGLAIAQRIVDLHQGDIWVEDNPEGGSVFFVRLPKCP
jgi:PAS domain S-box-containing protein